MHPEPVTERMRDPSNRQFGTGIDRAYPAHVTAPRRRVKTIDQLSTHEEVVTEVFVSFADAASINNG
jgi:hypothetical protein